MKVQGIHESEAAPRAFVWLAAVGLIGTCLTLWIAAWTTRGFPSAWPRFEDDAYYYLAIARNVASGHGFTMDAAGVCRQRLTVAVATHGRHVGPKDGRLRIA
jgi:hypothetical protein